LFALEWTLLPDKSSRWVTVGFGSAAVIVSVAIGARCVYLGALEGEGK
jgi:hypothetical protein